MKSDKECIVNNDTIDDDKAAAFLEALRRLKEGRIPELMQEGLDASDDRAGLWCQQLGNHGRLGFVDEVNGSGSEPQPGYIPTRHELLVLARHWEDRRGMGINALCIGRHLL
jgi:hypothetical protein